MDGMMRLQEDITWRSPIATISLSVNKFSIGDGGVISLIRLVQVFVT
jgi:hypothetical protein